MLILKQSTSIDIRMGPFVDVTDAVTPETGITLGAADQAEVLKANGAATVAMGGTFAAVTDADGWYDYTVATGDVDTVGEVVFVVQDLSVCLPVYTRAYVVEEAVYDAMYGASAAGPLQATTAGRTLDILATGEVPIDFDTSIGTLAAAQIEAGALDGKGNWNIGKTGYALTQAFPANFADLVIAVTTGELDVNVVEWLASAAPALVGGRLDASVGAMAAAVLTAAAINASALDGKGNWNIGKTGYTAGPTAASITTAAFAAGAINAAALAANMLEAAKINAAAFTAGKFATDAITSTVLAASAAQKIRDEVLPTQNEAFTFTFLFVAASDGRTPVTGASGITDFRSIDGAAFAAGGATVTEVGNGIYEYAATAGDMNGGVITFRFAATGGTPGAPDDTFVEVVTTGGV